MKFDTDDINAILDAVREDAVLIDQNGVSTAITVDHIAAGSIVMGMITEKPLITCAASLLSGVELKNSIIVHENIQYRMTSPISDGTGFITTALTKLQT